MRSDNHLNLAGGNLFQHRLPFAFLDTPPNNGNLIMEWRQNSLCVEKVLLGENFGGRHKRSLESIGNGDHNRLKCDNRLTASDIALQQSDHRTVRLQIFNYVLQDTFL